MFSLFTDDSACEPQLLVAIKWIVSDVSDRVLQRVDRMLRRLDGHTDSIYSLAFSPDGALLATGDYGSGTPTIRLWDTVTGQTNRIFHHSREMAGCCGGVGSLAFSSALHSNVLSALARWMDAAKNQ